MMKSKLVSTVFLCLMINSQWSKCDSEFQNDREKRTLGVFFKSFVDAFQTQRQPAPNVVSFKPSPQQSSQSIKADILSSSKTLLLKKQNILKPPTTTRTPVKEVIPILPPAKAVKPISLVPKNQPDAFLPNSPIDSFKNLENYQQFAPFKAQVLVLPFQGHEGSKTPFAGFGIQPHFASTISPLNYQAELFLQPAFRGNSPSTGYFPERFSPDNGWHNVDGTIPKNVQSTKVEKVESGISDFTTLKNIESNKYEAEIKPETGGTNFGAQKSIGPYHPLFFPQATNSYFNSNSQIIQGDVEASNQLDVKSQSIPEVVNDPCKKLSLEALQRLRSMSQAATTPQNNEDSPRVSDSAVLLIRNWSENTDFMPQRALGSKLLENFQNKKYDHQQNNHKHVQYPEQIYNSQFDIPFPEHGLVYLPQHQQVHDSEASNIHTQDKSHQQEQIYQDVPIQNQEYYNNNYEYHQGDQYHTKIGKLPSRNIGFGDQYPPSSYHQTLTANDSPYEQTEVTNSHPNGYYHFKRSY